MTQSWPYSPTAQRILPRGCRVTEHGGCPLGLHIEEHVLSDDRAWLHPESEEV